MRRTTLASLLFLIAFGTAWGASVPSARACSGSAPGNITSRLVIPADGSTAVPINAKIVVSYVSLADIHPVVDHLTLKTAGGADVPVTVSQPVSDTSGYLVQKVFVLAPTVSLQPNTKYSVFSDLATLPCDQNAYRMSGSPHPPCTPLPDGGVADGGAGVASTAISGFTTGNGADNTPPTLSGEITYAAEAQSCDSSPCCGPYDGFSVLMGWTAAADGGGQLFYELSREGVVLRYPIQDGQNQISGTSVRGAFLCSGNKWISSFGMFGFEAFQGQPGTYQVVAVDLAGNRSQPISVSVTVGCASPDGGAVAVDVGPSIDTQEPSWDGLYALADVPPGQVDLAVEADAAMTVDAGALPDAATILRTDTATPDVASVVVSDGPVAAEDVQPATPDAAFSERTKDGAGCSCRLGGGGSDRFAGLALVVFGFVLVVRGRRRRSH